MVQTSHGKQEVLFRKRSDLEEYDWISVDYESWTLKRSKNELHSFDVTLTYPEEWIDPQSPTGIVATIGDEIELYATFGLNDDDNGSIKRFGGYITEVDLSWDGSVKATIKCNDYRVSLKNKQIFKNYKTIPQSVGMQSVYMKQMYSATSLYDAIIYLCGTVGITDDSKLTSPYAWTRSNTNPLTMTTGSSSYCDTFTGIFNLTTKKTFNTVGCHRIMVSKYDPEVVFELYNNKTGYDATTHPHVALNYHKWKKLKTQLGFRFTINGTYYYLPWFDNLSEYSGNFLPGITGKNTSKPTALVINIKDLMDSTYPGLVYQITKIELVSKKQIHGYLYLADVGGLDGYQTIKPTYDYTYEDALSLANNLATQCGHYFNITPNKEIELLNLETMISDRSIIEGDNLISANLKTDDDSFYNNVVMLAQTKKNKSIVCQDIDLQSILTHGEYDKVEENSTLYTKTDVQSAVEEEVASSSELIPTYTCNVHPDFGYKEGEVIYIYNPSLGVERSLETQSVTWTHDGNCSLELGSPTTDLAKILLKWDQNQKLGTMRTIETYSRVNNVQNEILTSTGVYATSRGILTFKGEDIVETGVDLKHDQITSTSAMLFPNGLESDPYWMSPGNDVTIGTDGVKYTFTGVNNTVGGTTGYIPLALPLGVNNGLRSISVTFSWNGFNPSDPTDMMSISGIIYSDFDHENPDNGQLANEDFVYAEVPSTASGTFTRTVDFTTDAVGSIREDLPSLEHYIMLFVLELVTESSNRWVRIDEIVVSYDIDGGQE